MPHLLLAGYEDVPSFLNQSKLKTSLILFTLLHRLQEYSATRNSYSKTHMFRIIENTFSGNSCARKMSHLLLAGYEDVPSFLNQSKLKRSLVLFILLHRLQEYSTTRNSYSKTHIFRIIENVKRHITISCQLIIFTAFKNSRRNLIPSKRRAFTCVLH